MLLLLPMDANNRFTLFVRFCISLTLLVGYISCSGWRFWRSSICSCCLTMVSFNCRSALTVFSLKPVDADVWLRILFSSLLKNILKFVHVLVVAVLSSQLSQLRSYIPVFLIAIYAFRSIVRSEIGSFPASAKILHSSM